PRPERVGAHAFGLDPRVAHRDVVAVLWNRPVADANHFGSTVADRSDSLREIGHELESGRLLSRRRFSLARSKKPARSCFDLTRIGTSFTATLRTNMAAAASLRRL